MRVFVEVLALHGLYLLLVGRDHSWSGSGKDLIVFSILMILLIMIVLNTAELAALDIIGANSERLIVDIIGVEVLLWRERVVVGIGDVFERACWHNSRTLMLELVSECILLIVRKHILLMHHMIGPGNVLGALLGFYRAANYN